MSLFGTAGIRGSVVESVPPELALRVGRVVGLDAVERGVPSVVLGRDGRVTGRALENAVAAGLLSAGADVRRAGRLPTPALAYASRGRVGVMLTASHNPPSDNGIKLFADGVEFDEAAETDIERRLDGDPTPARWDAWGSSERVDVVGSYRDAVVAYASQFGASLDGLSVALDCGNGTAALAVPQVLEGLGARVTALNANLDGHFPGRPSKPTPETLVTLRTTVADGPYALGFGHDGDADRIVVVDENGDIVHEDTVLAVLAERYAATVDVEEPVVVTTPNASGRIDERVNAAGGRTTRVALGALADGMARVRDAGGTVAFAAEPWKHVHPQFGGWIDGVASAAVIARLVAAAGDVGALTGAVSERPYVKDQVACPEAEKPAVMDHVARELPARFPEASVDREHGVRLDFPDGSWVLVRPSGTEPLVRLYAESDDVDALLSASKAIVEAAVAA